MPVSESRLAFFLLGNHSSDGVRGADVAQDGAKKGVWPAPYPNLGKQRYGISRQNMWTMPALNWFCLSLLDVTEYMPALPPFFTDWWEYSA